MENLEYIIKFVILPAAGIIIIIAYQIGKRVEHSKIQKKQKAINKNIPAYSRDTAYMDNKLSTLNSQINNLNELNARYFNFTQKLTDVVKQLYSSLSFDDLTSTVILLVKDIINTDTIEFYVFDTEKNILKKTNQLGKTTGEQVSYAPGEGLIGNAGKDGIIKVRGLSYKGVGLEDQGKTGDKLSMAAPIHFKNKLLGVIGIGEIKKPTGNDRNLLKMIADIASVVLINQSYLKEWKDESITDPLTGLYNRRYFFYMTLKYAEKSLKEDLPISVCLLDIDNFKHYNDTNGHQEGDRLLKEFSDLLTKSSRKGTIIARYGGEEFIVMLPGSTKEDALVYAERIKDTIVNHMFPHGDKQPLGFLSVSGGIASYPKDADTIERAIQLADAALYKAKNEGRNRMIIHKPVLFSDKSIGY